MRGLVKDLWAGEVPLGEAFWRYAVVYGLFVNVATTGLFLILLVRDAGPALLTPAFMLPIPYNLFVIVAVWRSAARYQGPKSWADTARVAAAVWLLLLTAS